MGSSPGVRRSDVPGPTEGVQGPSLAVLRAARALLAGAAVVVVLVLALAMTQHRGVTSLTRHRIRTAATVVTPSAGGSCVNVWMGGNPDDPNACRPAPAP